ncbi:MAG: hypothetical protein ACLP8S_17095 [Solirubrobacteraceae bacterium]
MGTRNGLTVYRHLSKPMNEEDLTEIDRAGRRCAVCRSGRHWRQLEVIRTAGRDPLVLCAGCRARHPLPPPIREAPPVVVEPEQPASAPARVRRAEQEDRLKRVLRELPRGEHSTGRIAKAAGLNHAKTLGRLHKLKAAGEVHQVGKLWSTEPPANGLEAAFDRLQAQTSNLRIIRERPPVG